MIGLLGLATVAAARLAVPDCAIERSVYRLHGAPQFTAGFARQDRRKPTASDLAFWLKTPLRTYWFSFSSPNGYGGTYIVPDDDPVRSAAAAEPLPAPAIPEGEEGVQIEFDAFAADLGAFEMPPQRADSAPALLFARGLGPALWYDAVGLAGGDAAAATESLPVGLFEFASCSAP